ncbi:hypothetical protein BDC45DRAFT_434273 [Circinella umbellata]|nr:hypothetical protein BDC45DRAFT_434273 [Circinella umbellata]
MPIRDPEKLVLLRWTNTTPNKSGELRPNTVICKRQQLEYEGSIGYEEAEVNQGNSNRYLLCMDTVRLAIFNKNAIVVNKLDGALALQIMVRNHLSPSLVNLDFSELLGDLPSFISLRNITLLLGVNNVFGAFAKN